MAALKKESGGLKEELLDEARKRWLRFLRGCIDDFRSKNPGDTRSDVEITEDLMEHFERAGLVKRRNGKWVLPRIAEN